MAYDDENVFAKILRGEIPCAKVYEDDCAFAFNDINPQAPVHVLVIPRGPYASMDDFTANATDTGAGQGVPSTAPRPNDSSALFFT